jgi:nucleoside-diphosphate-sugar epimerase
MFDNSRKKYKSQSIIITGASGLLGKNLTQKISSNKNLIVLGRNNYDYYYDLNMNLKGLLPNGLRVKKFIHAAYDHSNQIVDGDNINIYALKNIAEYCEFNKIQLIYISSMAAMSGISNYGRRKRECELIVEGVSNSAILRLGMLHGEGIGIINSIRKLISWIPFTPIPGSGNFLVYLSDLSRVTDFIANANFTNKKYYYLVDSSKYFSALISQKDKPKISIPIGLIKIALLISKLFGINLKSISYDGFIGLINPPKLPVDVKTYDEN